MKLNQLVCNYYNKYNDVQILRIATVTATKLTR